LRLVVLVAALQLDSARANRGDERLLEIAPRQRRFEALQILLDHRLAPVADRASADDPTGGRLRCALEILVGVGEPLPVSAAQGAAEAALAAPRLEAAQSV